MPRLLNYMYNFKISRIDDCSLNRIASLPVDHEQAACNSFHSNGELLAFICFNTLDSSHNYKHCYTFKPEGNIVQSFVIDSLYSHRWTQIVNLDNNLFVTGSWNPNSYKTEIFQFSTQTWVEKADYPGHVISDYAAIALSSSVYIFGGYYNAAAVSRVARFERNAWSIVGQMQGGRRGHQVVDRGDYIFIVGGNSYNRRTEKWDLASNSSIEIGAELSHFAYYPPLHIVHQDHCSPCVTDCDGGVCVNVDGNRHCQCSDGFTNQDGKISNPCQPI